MVATVLYRLIITWSEHDTINQVILDGNKFLRLATSMKYKQTVTFIRRYGIMFYISHMSNG